jgi:DNA-binding transcriptional LysR family regulator
MIKLSAVCIPPIYRTRRDAATITHPTFTSPPQLAKSVETAVARDWEFAKGGVELKIEVAGPLTLGDPGLMVEAALDGAGIAFAFESQVAQLIAARKLIRVLEDWCPYGDRVKYSVAVGAAPGPFEVAVELLYQPIGYRWAKNLQSYDAHEVERFTRYFDAAGAASATVLAKSVASGR